MRPDRLSQGVGQNADMVRGSDEQVALELLWYVVGVNDVGIGPSSRHRQSGIQRAVVDGLTCRTTIAQRQLSPCEGCKENGNTL